VRQQQPEPLEFQKLLFHPGIGLSVGLPRAMHRLLVPFADLFTQIVWHRALLYLSGGSATWSLSHRRLGRAAAGDKNQRLGFSLRSGHETRCNDVGLDRLLEIRSKPLKSLVPGERFELPTNGLQNRAVPISQAIDVDVPFPTASISARH
jgi:hypothetical protein